MYDELKFLEKEFLNESGLIDRTVKTRTINSIKEKLKELSQSTDKDSVLSVINSLLRLVEDAYKVDMYKFQFKLFTLSIQKEIKNLEFIIQ
jgi:hypothetical protein